MNDRECVAFLQWALPRMGMRWRGFRKVRRQVCRRIGRRIAELELRGPGAYRTYLEEHPEEWPVLEALCRVTISRFVRDREVWRVLGEEVLPALVRTGAAPTARPSTPVEASTLGAPALDAWSVGCASGEEPYTLVLLWRLGRGPRPAGTELRVLATDLDPVVLERAYAARYPPGALREVDPAWLKRAFHEEDGELVLREEFRGGVRFENQDVRREMPDGPFDLILCRNLAFTYFDEAVQSELLGRFLERLAPRGVLMMGGHERLPPGKWPLEPWAPGLPIFRRTR